MLRRRQENYSIQLYTYGAPRAADSTFIKNAETLMHYRMVNHNDPVPSLPGSWMNTKTEVYGAGMALMRSEEHTSELQSLMRISYAVFCLKKKKKKKIIDHTT